MSLDRKHALITGGSRGIGRGIALKLAEHGVKVAVHYYKNKEAATDTLAKGPGARFGWFRGSGRRCASRGHPPNVQRGSERVRWAGHLCEQRAALICRG